MNYMTAPLLLLLLTLPPLHTYFFPPPPTSTTSLHIAPLVPGDLKYSNSRSSKETRITTIKSLLQNSELLISLQLDQFTVKHIQTLRTQLPVNTTVIVLKNTLLKRAAAELQAELDLQDICQGSNLWICIPKDIATTVVALQEFLDAHQHDFDEKVIQNGISFKWDESGMMYYDQETVKSVLTLKTKDEYMIDLCRALKSIPERLCRAIATPGMKVGNMLKLIQEKTEERERGGNSTVSAVITESRQLVWA